METLVLTLAGGGAAGLVVPRRLKLSLEPGEGRLHLEGAATGDAAWRASLSAAWDAAQALAGRRDADARVEVVGAAGLQGGSAGLSFGLLALAALLEEPPLPPHFATGAVAEGGFLAGGASVQPKATAAAGYAKQLGMGGAVFLCPPVHAPADAGIPILPACDLAQAFARLSPAGHARIAATHAQMRRAPDAPPGPFARVETRDPLALPPRLGEIALESAEAEVPEGAARVTVGEDKRVLWRAHAPVWTIPQVVPELLALARATSSRP